MEDQQNQAGSSTASRAGRSRHGCLTCKRRKVRCNEQRPRCSHCERLNLQCSWKPIATAQRRQQRAHNTATHNADLNVELSQGGSNDVGYNETVWAPTVAAATASTSTPPSVSQTAPAVDNIFDYAAFMWDSPDWWQQHQANVFMPSSWDAGHTVPDSFVSPDSDAAPGAQRYSFVPGLQSSPKPRHNEQTERVWRLTQNRQGDDSLLLDCFAHSTAPPILSSIETQQAWSSMRRSFVLMAKESTMVRSALLTFAHLLLRPRRSISASQAQGFYQESSEELARQLSASAQSAAKREHQLATCFFLSYVDILERRMEAAHASLKAAHTIFTQGDKTTFSTLELRILSWIRLLDGRAVSAGGEGLFLSDDDATQLLVHPSPATIDSVQADESLAYSHVDQDAEVEDVLFQALYEPGSVFFHKVQSFMGRISKVDPWHRSRGTVADETEVMIIAAAITKDLDALFDTRPRLMDYAVKGQLTAQHLSPHLAHTITRAFRTYASNYYASKVHLHRVAYKTLPLAMETVLALAKIKELARMMADTPPSIGANVDEPLPVNMLWPLLMLGSEEEDLQERAWIRNQICRMQEVASNALMTAQVLDEVQKMQDETKTRMDIRSVMHKIFDACFAIV